MPTITVENYVKQLWLEQQKKPSRLVPMGQLARAMNVVPGTATTMIKALADAGLVEYEPRTGVRLTRGGQQLALHVLRRHRLVEVFLVKVLGLDWSEVHREADDLEHAISDKVLDKIDALLGYPSEDPHGDPIPTAKGKVNTRELQSLDTFPVGKKGRVARVVDQDSRFLRFAEQHALIPGQPIAVISRNLASDSMVVRSAKGNFTLGLAAAGKVLVAES